VERKGTQIQVSDQVLFFDDETAFKGTARYDGKPAVAEAFGIVNIKGLAPTTTCAFAADTANTPASE
ncbi:MAG: phage major capsid protein, partial [Longicatena sp.]